jgi:hypothetical protein
MNLEIHRPTPAQLLADLTLDYWRQVLRLQPGLLCEDIEEQARKLAGWPPPAFRVSELNWQAPWIVPADQPKRVWKSMLRLLAAEGKVSLGPKELEDVAEEMAKG